MNKLILTIAILITSYSAQAKEPKWIKDISKGCKRKSELCALGTGVSRAKADQYARVALAKIFENKVTSNFKSNLSSNGSATYEEMSEDIMESTQMAMEGLEIKETYEDRLNFYSLAVVNKNKMARSLKRQIDSIDEKMQVFLEDDSAASKVKLEKQFVKREALSKNYEFLTGISLRSPIAFDQVFQSKKSIVGSVIAHVYLDEDEPKTVETLIVKLLGDAGYKTTSGRVRNKKCTHIVTGQVVADKQYMNVDGFEKYTISLKLTAMNNASVETGSLAFSTTEVGRNFSQAYNKGLKTIRSYLEDNLTTLNIE